MEIPLAEAKKLCTDPSSGFCWVSAEELMSLPPKHLGCISQGIREELDARCGFVCEKYEGAVVHYMNIRLKGNTGRVIDDSPYININVLVDFIVFQPRVGSVLQGVVNKLGKDHIGLLVHHHFNASIRLTGRPEEEAVAKGDTCRFTVVRIHTHRKLLSLTGKLA